jgi:hypothetical protein
MVTNDNINVCAPVTSQSPADTTVYGTVTINYFCHCIQPSHVHLWLPAPALLHLIRMLLLLYHQGNAAAAAAASLCLSTHQWCKWHPRMPAQIHNTIVSHTCSMQAAMEQLEPPHSTMYMLVDTGQQMQSRFTG